MQTKAPRAILIGFMCAVLLGSLLLYLPISRAQGHQISYIDSLFTATSAICVTGLTVQNISSCFSPFGKMLILILMQIGGLGIVVFSVLLAIILGRKIALTDNVIVQTTLDNTGIQGIKYLILSVIGLTLLIELIGALFLFLRWQAMGLWSLKERIVHSIFNSISAFCNAGFALFPDNFEFFRGDSCTNLVIMLLIFFGGLGFLVLIDIIRFFTAPKKYPKRLILQSKIVLLSSLLLIFVGALAIFFFDSQIALKGFSMKEKIYASAFQSVTARTAGFNTINIASLSDASKIFVILLMFIGASPGSTGGGIKTCTFVVLLASFFSIFRQEKEISIFKRTIPKDIFYRAFGIFFASLAVVIFISLLLSYVENHFAGKDFLSIIFEVTSAFGTVGLSTGITPFLSNPGKLLIILTMFIGKVGPLTAGFAIATGKTKSLYKYSEEKVMVG